MHRAAEEFDVASSLSPDDCRLMEFKALMQLAAGEIDAYRTTCADMMWRFGKTQDSAVATTIVDGCVLRPDALSDWNQLVIVGKIATISYFGSVRVLGAAHFRAGQFREAIGCFERAAKVGPLGSHILRHGTRPPGTKGRGTALIGGCNTLDRRCKPLRPR